MTPPYVVSGLSAVDSSKSGRLLGRRIWTALLTGVPFAVYKFSFGWYEFHHDHSVLGIVAMTWGIIDLAINVMAALFPKMFSWCLLANIGRWLDRVARKTFWENFLLAIDTTASFLIVSIMIWFWRLPLEPMLLAQVWNLAVIANILSVGIEQIYQSARDRQPAVKPAD